MTCVNPDPATGLRVDFRHSRGDCALDPGDLFLGFTDVVIESPNAEGEFNGDERLNASLGGEEICARLVDELATCSGRTVFEDDVWIVAIESTGATCVIPLVSCDIGRWNALRPTRSTQRLHAEVRLRAPHDTF